MLTNSEIATRPKTRLRETGASAKPDESMVGTVLLRAAELSLLNVRADPLNVAYFAELLGSNQQLTTEPGIMMSLDMSVALHARLPVTKLGHKAPSSQFPSDPRLRTLLHLLYLHS